MSRIIKRIEFQSRGISFSGVVIFASMGKYVTDWLGQFSGHGWRVTPISEEEYDSARAEALAVSPQADLTYEDQLPDDMTAAEYDAWYRQSMVVAGVRVGPRFTRRRAATHE